MGVGRFLEIGVSFRRLEPAGSYLAASTSHFGVVLDSVGKRTDGGGVVTVMFCQVPIRAVAVIHCDTAYYVLTIFGRVAGVVS